jgi:hypothetical protein
MARNIRALAITGAVMAAVTYVVCAAFVALAPDLATGLGSDITHINLSGVGRAVTWGGALKGGLFFTAFVALVCAASGWLYNRVERA